MEANRTVISAQQHRATIKKTHESAKGYRKNSLFIILMHSVGDIQHNPSLRRNVKIGALPPGLYPCRLIAGDAEMMAKMVVVR